MTVLHFVQKFGEGCNITTLTCDDDCGNRAIAMYADEQNNALALCEKHRALRNAPIPPPGIEYMPTKCLMERWHMEKGVPTFDPRARSRFKEHA